MQNEAYHAGVPLEILLPCRLRYVSITYRNHALCSPPNSWNSLNAKKSWSVLQLFSFNAPLIAQARGCSRSPPRSSRRCATMRFLEVTLSRLQHLAALRSHEAIPFVIMNTI